MRPSTGDTLRLLLRRAAGRLQTEISHADRDFSLAVAVLHAFDVASLPLQHQKAKGGVFARIRWRRSRCNIKRSGGLSLSSAKRLLCGSTGDFVVSFFFFGGFSVPGSLCCGRRRETHFVFVCVAPQVPCRQTSLSQQIATSPLHSLFCTQWTCTSLAL